MDMFQTVNQRADGSSYRSCSHTFADLVTGDWDFDGLDHTNRIAQIQSIIKLMEGLMTTGWTEHTNDWDWRISVVWGDAKIVAGTYEDQGDRADSWTDTIELRGDEIYSDTLHYLTVTEFRDDDQDGVEVLIPVADIRTIVVTEA